MLTMEIPMATEAKLRITLGSLDLKSEVSLGEIARDINEQIADEGYFSDIINMRFATEGASSGSKWRGLKTGTIKQRIRLGFGPSPILERSGTLWEAAATGRPWIGENAVIMEMAEMSAPTYTGLRNKKGQFKPFKQRFARRAPKNKMLKALGMASSMKMVSTYAGALNADRPFYKPPTTGEMTQVVVRQEELISQVVESMIVQEAETEGIGE